LKICTTVFPYYNWNIFWYEAKQGSASVMFEVYEVGKTWVGGGKWCTSVGFGSGHLQQRARDAD
jgi:hypothetical protein